MASTKTTWWGLGPIDTATVATAVTRTFPVTTIYVPETTSRTFRAAIVEVSFNGTETTAASITAAVAGLTVNATRTTSSMVGTLTNSGEKQGTILQFDFTAGVNTNFGAGASQTMTFDIVITGVGSNNCSAVLKLTYDYDEAVATHCKTAIIPLESTTGAIPTTLNSIGSNQIPILTGASGIIKEDSPVIRDYFFLINGSENSNGGTTAITLAVALDSDGASSFGAIVRTTLGTDSTFQHVWSKKAAVPTTTATHDFKAFCGTASHHHMSILLVVTYECASNSAAALNSIQIPFQIGEQGGTIAGNQAKVRIPFDIEEPATIALVQSGVKFTYAILGAMTTAGYINFQVGAQTVRAYTSNQAAGSATGSQVISQRIDSGSAGGAGITLARGQCYVDVAVYCTTQRTLSGISGILYLNYTSGAAGTTGGIAKHNHTVYNNLETTHLTAGASFKEIASRQFTFIADTYYALQSVGIYALAYWIATATSYWIRYQAERLSGDGPLALGDGFHDLGLYAPAAIVEAGAHQFAEQSTDLWKRNPADPIAGRATITTARTFRWAGPRAVSALQTMTTYHSLTWTGTRAVTDYTGTGAVPVKIHDYTTGELLFEVTAAVGGVYTYLVYDNTRQLISRTYESASGRSGASVPWTAT